MSSAAAATAGNRPRGWRRVLLGLGVAIGVIGAGAFIYSETRRAERDRHAVIQEVRELERLIRRHDQQLLTFDDGSGRIGGSGEQSVNRDTIMRDLDRLGHVEGLRLTDIVVTVRGETALATYRVEGSPRPPAYTGGSFRPEPPPSGGEMSFARFGERWQLVGNRFLP